MCQLERVLITSSQAGAHGSWIWNLFTISVTQLHLRRPRAWTISMIGRVWVGGRLLETLLQATVSFLLLAQLCPVANVALVSGECFLNLIYNFRLSLLIKYLWHGIYLILFSLFYNKFQVLFFYRNRVIFLCRVCN